MLIRFLVMPFFCHLDFFSEYRRIHFQIIEHNFFPGSRFIVTLVEMLNYLIALPFLGDVDSMFYLADAANSTASHQDFFVFVSHFEVFRTLFFLKLGYLGFDLLTGWLIFRFFENPRQGLIAAGVWLFNPITIFSFYIFGRYESIALFFLLLSIHGFQKKKPILACLGFGLCVWSREVFVLILPIFILALGINKDFSWKNKFIGAGLLFIIFSFVSNAFPSWIGFKSVLESSYGSMAEQNQIFQVIAFAFNWYYPIIVIYTLLLFYLATGREDITIRLSKSILGFFLSFFLFSIHSIHYVAWLFPTLCLFIPQTRHMMLGCLGFILSWIAYWLVATDLGVFTAWLAAPVSTHFLNMPNIPVLLGEILPHYTALQVGHLVAILKSVNAGCIIFMAYCLFKQDSNRDSVVNE